MSRYVIVEHQLGAPSPVSQTDSVQRWPLGYQAKAVDNAIGAGEFVYAQGSNVASIGQFVQVQNNSAVLLGTVNSASHFPVGVAAGLLSATNAYGWVQVQGVCDYARGTNSSIGVGADLYIAAGTAGYLVTNVVTGNRVAGVVAPVSYTSSQSQALTVQLFEPYIAFLGDSRS
jgi:hypothetical protein